MSLRDVERAMRVMLWFYNHRDALNPLMDEELEEEDEESEDENENIDDEEEDEQHDLYKVKGICPLKTNRVDILNKHTLNMFLRDVME